MLAALNMDLRSCYRCAVLQLGLATAWMNGFGFSYGFNPIAAKILSAAADMDDLFGPASKSGGYGRTEFLGDNYPRIYFSGRHVLELGGYTTSLAIPIAIR